MLRTGPSAESLLIGAVGVLCLLGLVMVYSASSVASVQGGASSWAVVSRQALFMCLGLGLGVVASRIPVQVWRDRIAVPLMVLAVSLQLLLALDVVLRSAGGPGMPFAVSVNGTNTMGRVRALQRPTLGPAQAGVDPVARTPAGRAPP